MLTRKKSITVPADVLESVAPFIGEAGFSAYVTEALRQKAALAQLELLNSEMEQRCGPVPDDAMARFSEKVATAQRRR